MKFQLLSDLHIEFSPFRLCKSIDANFLILAGDIGNPLTMIYKDFIKEVSGKYEKVFVIRGNHEIYGMTLEYCDDTIKKICESYDNVIYLQRTSFDIENTDIRIIGATLWTKIKDEERKDIQKYMSDYRYIKNWSIEKQRQEHDYDTSFLEREIIRANDDNKKLIISTHHAPYTHNVQHPIYDDSDLSSAFMVDMSYLFSNLCIHTWVYGHTHYSSKQQIGHMNLFSNQRGYIDEEFDTRFEPLFLFHV
jgi:predicted phosphodiesterase